MIRISKPIVREVDRKVFLVSYMSDNKSKTEVNPNGEEVFYARQPKIMDSISRMNLLIVSL